MLIEKIIARAFRGVVACGAMKEVKEKIVNYSALIAILSVGLVVVKMFDFKISMWFWIPYLILLGCMLWIAIIRGWMQSYIQVKATQTNESMPSGDSHERNEKLKGLRKTGYNATKTMVEFAEENQAIDKGISDYLKQRKEQEEED